MRVAHSLHPVFVDDEFSTSSAGELRAVATPSSSGDDHDEAGRAVFEVPYLPEQIPGWFEQLLEELFGGGGVPKEYMAHVRVTDTRGEQEGDQPVTLRFLLSEKGRSYMHLPYWSFRAPSGWSQLPSAACTLYWEGEPVAADAPQIDRVDVRLALAPGESVRVASAPYDTPEDICARAREIADESGGLWTYSEIGSSAQGRALPCLASPPRPLRVLLDVSPPPFHVHRSGVLCCCFY